jgi:endonuclease YncB( thermonuclease family)
MIKLSAICLSFAIICCPPALAANYVQPDMQITSIASIYDGDTIHVNISNWPPIVGQNIGVRIRGIDTPEMHDSRPDIKAKALAARTYVVKRLTGKHVIILRNIGRDKYFRLLANVEVDGRDLSKDLLAAGLARKYDGGKKSAW